MSENQIKIGASLDISKLDQQMSELQRKIKSIRETGPGGTYSQLAQQYRSQGDEQKAQRIEEFRNKQQAISKKELNNDLKQQEKTLQGLMRHYDNLQSGLSKITQGTDKWVEKSKNLKDAYEAIGKTIENISRSKEALEDDGPKTPGLLSRMGSFITGTAKVAGGIGAGVKAYGDIQSLRASLPGRQAVRDVDIAKSASQIQERAIKGKSFEDIVFAKEQGEAIAKGMQFYQDKQSARETRGYGNILQSLGLIGLGAGATVAGGPLGMAVGLPSIIAGAKGLANEETYYTLTGNKKELSKMTGKETLEEIEKYRLQNIYKDPERYIQTKFLGENRGALSKVQKSTGLTDEGMYGEGGFLKRGGKDFLFSQRAAMQQEIVGAGGATPGQSNIPILALQAQRNLGLTNSGQAMGRLTSYLKQSESEEAFVRILAKGFSGGLDNSDYREETKDYLAQVTSIAARMGGGQEMIAARIAAGMGDDISRRSVEKSAEASQSLNQYQEETGGVIGASKFRLMNEDPVLKRLKGMSRLSAQKLKVSDIAQGEKNPVMMNLLDEVNEGVPDDKKISMEDLQKRMFDIGKESIFGGFKPGQEVTKLLNEAKNEKDPTKKRKILNKAASTAYAMGFGSSAEESGRMIEQMGTELKSTVTEADTKGVRSKLEASPKEGLEIIGLAEAEAQFAAFTENIQKNYQKIFDTALQNVETNLANQITTSEFVTALEKGGEKLDAFVKSVQQVGAIKANQTKSKPK